MKSLGIISGGAVLAISMIAAAAAAEPASSISKQSLGSMGLGSMRPMADEDGLAVRGKGAFFGHLKPQIRPWFRHKKIDHRKGFDFKFGHKSFRGHKGFGPHKSFGHKGMGGHKTNGGMIWQPNKMVWNFGGGVKIH